MDQKDFDQIWSEVILFECKQLIAKCGGLEFNEQHSKEEIEQYYIEYRDYTKRHYMSHCCNPEERLLNRYKIAAAFMIAILKTKPLKKADRKYYKESPDKWIHNEEVALYTGLMIVRGFFLADAMKMNEGDPYRNFIISVFDKSVPSDVATRDKWKIELYYLRQEGSYNLLALAHELEDFIRIALYRKLLSSDDFQLIRTTRETLLREQLF